MAHEQSPCDNHEGDGDEEELLKDQAPMTRTEHCREEAGLDLFDSAVELTRNCAALHRKGVI